MKDVRKDFPILKRMVNGKKLIYLDNAATSQKPIQVINAVRDFYTISNSNVHRSIHTLGEEATQKFEEAHSKVAGFVGSNFEETIFTKSATESLNLLAYALGSKLKSGDEIVVSKMEHHSNFIPWQEAAKRSGASIKFVDVKDGKIDMHDLDEKITNRTRIVSVTHASNVLGTINPVKEISKMTRGAFFIVDGAQSVPHFKVNVKKLGCDFLVFSGHKMLGPTGVGVLIGKEEHLEKMDPFLFGGEMIREVTLRGSKWNDLPWKFEAGTPNITQGIGLGAAVDYLNSVGMEDIKNHEAGLARHAMKKLNEISGIEIYGPEERIGVISFNLKGVHPHDVPTVLDQDGIAIRAGHQCAMPLHAHLGLVASARASFYLYNTKSEVDKLAESLERVKRIFRV